MKLNPDTVPASFPEAVETFYAALEEHDKAALTTAHKASLHMGSGQFIRNFWSFWDKDTPLAIDFRSRFKLFGHGDDISSLLLDSVRAKCLGVLFIPLVSVRHYRAHWTNQGVDPYTGELIFEDGSRDHPLVAGGADRPTLRKHFRCSDCLTVTYNDGSAAKQAHHRSVDSCVDTLPYYCGPCLTRSVYDTVTNQYEP